MYNFIKGQFTEEELEKAIINLFRNEDYDYLDGETIHRQFSDVILYADFMEYINTKYKDDELTDNEKEIIFNEINLISATSLYEGNKEAYLKISEGFDLVRDDANKIALHIDFIDFDEVDNNLFKVVNQYSVQGIESIRRPDLIVFINGIPVSIFEFKSAIKEDTTIHNAWEQISIRYTRDIPNLMKYCFLSVISDGANNRMGSIFTPYEYYYSWNKANDEEKVSNGISSILTLIKGAFARDRLLSILRDFIFYPDKSEKQLVIIPRYPQFFAANKMVENIKSHMKPEGDGKGGIYFGATGCGKTYTMLFLSRLIALRDSNKFNNPTIIIIEDREDLDTQTSELFVNATKYLHDKDVRSIESREDLQRKLKDKKSGGIYITTIQKFCESTGLLSDRNNIICISDEAHRTQTNTGSKLKKTDEGVFTTYGFAKYLRDSFPNATYCGFTGTPIDESIAVFGEVVDSYTMKESSDDGITCRIAYEPRLARVLVSDAKAKEIQKYYQKCLDDGANPEQVAESERAMSSISMILGDTDVLEALAKDIVEHYEALCAEKPKVVQKAMIVCPDRKLAYKMYKQIGKIRPEWLVPKKADNEEELTKEQLNELLALPKINLVATQGDNDEDELFKLCGTKDWRQNLDKQFKNNNSNFKIAIVVDMWITGFDVPSLAVMYINKPLKRHTLVQTISRVNRIFTGKEKGLIVDYIGIKKEMMEAIKKYSNSDFDSPIDELAISLGVFRNHLALIDDIMLHFNSTKYFYGTPLERLICLNEATEYIQTSKDRETSFMAISRKLKSAYNIVYASGELNDDETAKAQLYLAIRSIIYKMTMPNVPDAEIMNKTVEKMVENAITCSGVENIVDNPNTIDLFSEEFLKELDKVKLPITKFNALLKLLKKAISNYGKINRVKSIEFDEKLKRVVEIYNNRDKLVFTNEVVSDFVNDLSDKLIEIMKELEIDKTSFEQMGITFEEKAFFDILVKVRDTHQFQYEDEKCIILAKKIKKLVEDKSQFADFLVRDDIRNQLIKELTILLYKNGYPPDWNQDVFEKIFEQAENFKKFN